MSRKTMMMELIQRLGGVSSSLIELRKDLQSIDSLDDSTKKVIVYQINSMSDAISEATKSIYGLAEKTEKTFTQEEIIKKIMSDEVNQWELRDYFDFLPIRNIREAAIAKMEFRSESDCQWAEDRIWALEGAGDNKICRMLIEKYLSISCTHSGKKFKIRAMESFLGGLDEPGMLSFSHKQIFYSTNEILKEDILLWWEAPSVYEVIQKMFFQIRPNEIHREYSRKEWVETRRAIERVVEAGDVSYLSDIKRFEKLISSGELKLEEPNLAIGEKRRFAENDENLAFLNAAIRELEGFEKEQGVGIESILGLLKKETKIMWSTLRFEICPIEGEFQKTNSQYCMVAEAGQPLEIVFRFSLTPGITEDIDSIDISKKLEDVFSKFRIRGHNTNISSQIKPLDPIDGSDYGRFCGVCDGTATKYYCAGLIVTPNRGHNRVFVEIEYCGFDGTKSIGIMIYIIGKNKIGKSAE